MTLNRLRSKLVAVFLAATLLPLGATLWVSSALMKRSLAFVETGDVPALSRSLERTAREYYRQARDQLAADARSGAAASGLYPARARATWPTEVQEFWDSGDRTRFVLSEPGGGRLYYLVRQGAGVVQYSRDLPVRLGDVTREIRLARSHAGDLERRDLQRGFALALVVSSAVVWMLALAVVLFLSSRISTPIEHLTAGLTALADGRFGTRIAARGFRHSRARPPGSPRTPGPVPPPGHFAHEGTRGPRHDEIGRAIEAFNHTAAELQQNRDRLIYLTQVASWQMLARKMAHELKNSLTPIRLTIEEVLARRPSPDGGFLDQAARIVGDEVDSLERRVRAFSEFAAEPAVNPSALDLNVLLQERVALLRVAHPGVTYQVEPARDLPPAWADADQVKGILTNLLENAAEAAGGDGLVLTSTGVQDGQVQVEVHDSGPGLSAQARTMLFEPAISFKKRGMGLGLAISRKNALVAGGDLALVDGRLGGAAFRLSIPRARL